MVYPKAILQVLFVLAVFVTWSLPGERSLAATAAQQAPILTFGVVPQQSTLTLVRLWTPMLAYISEKTGYTLQFRTAPTIPMFEQRLANSAYDLAYMNPYHYTVSHQSPGYEAFAKAQDERLSGIVVVGKHSPYHNVSELAGKVLAFPAPTAFAASVLTRAHFKALGIPITAKYVSSHDSVYRAVVKGLYPAGGGVRQTLDLVAPDIRDNLRILYTTPSHTSHAIAAHPAVPHEVVKTMQRVMVMMSRDAAGRQLLQRLSWQGIEAAEDAQWDDVRSLGITLLSELIKE